jgi:hypothetical protein
LLQLNAVVGVTGFFSSPTSLQSIGIQCALCHSTVDDSLAPGIGHRLDGWPNRDLRIGDIIASAPNLTPIVNLLQIANPGITVAAVQSVLHGWGPGKFDAELLMDGKFFNAATVGLPPNGVTATLIPPAFGLGGVTLHTWTGWGSIPHWNAFVANLEMHGIGRFWDPRLNNAAQFPIAANSRIWSLTGNQPGQRPGNQHTIRSAVLSVVDSLPAASAGEFRLASRGTR